MRSQDVLIIYNALSPTAMGVAEALAERLGTRLPPSPADTLSQEANQALASVSLVVTVGGDGTILRAVKLAAPLGVPLLGVNLGRLGFLTEVEGADALERVPRYLEEGFAWVQARTMLEVQACTPSQLPCPTAHLLNEVVVTRGPTARVPRIRVRVDGADLATYSGDAVIVASATGSTAYTLSAGGPILYPTSTDMLIKAVAPHGDLAAGVIVPGNASVELTIQTADPCFLNGDGYWSMEVGEEHVVRVTKSPLIARFLRAGPPERFYETLLYRLHRGPAAPASLSQSIGPESA
jgi:NAD+ kinase